MRKETAEKIIVIADNSTQREVKSFDVDSEKPFSDNWVHLGDDYFEGPDGICGPSGGNSTRTFVPFGEMSDNIPSCPVCNGSLKAENHSGYCLCFPCTVRENYGL